MTEPDEIKDEILNDLGQAMMNMREISAPVEEAARGMRWDLIKQHGWSAQSADQMACQWYILVLVNMQAAAMGRNTDSNESGN